LSEARRLVLTGHSGGAAPTAVGASSSSSGRPLPRRISSHDCDSDEELQAERIDVEVYFSAACAIHDEEGLAAARRAVLGTQGASSSRHAGAGESGPGCSSGSSSKMQARRAPSSGALLDSPRDA
jgi:hypothetical protein